MRAARAATRGRDEAGRVGEQVGGQRAVALLGAAQDLVGALQPPRGSASSVGIGTNIVETRLPNVPICSSVRTDTGTIATSGSVGQLVALEQPVAHRARAERDDDVVDRHAERVLDRLDAVERQRAEREAPVRPRSRPLKRVRGARALVHLEHAGPSSAPASRAQRATSRARASARRAARWRPGRSVRCGSAVGSERSARSGWRGSAEQAAAEHLELARHALAGRAARAPAGARGPRGSGRAGRP